MKNIWILETATGERAAFLNPDQAHEYLEAAYRQSIKRQQVGVLKVVFQFRGVPVARAEAICFYEEDAE